jgi:hypothetical protein
MATQRKPRFMISLDEEDADVLTQLQDFTNLSPAQTIQKLFPSHLAELNIYLDWLKQLPKDNSLKSQLGPFLLQSYGPESLIEGIKKLDPDYVASLDPILTSGTSHAY